MGKRYIEVKESNQKELEWALERSSGGAAGSGDGVMRLRGMPWNSSVQDVISFCSGLNIVSGGVTIAVNEDGSQTGDAYVEFATIGEADRAAKEKHKEKIGHRYIEVFKSSKSELLAAKQMAMGGGMQQFRGQNMMMGGRPGPYDRPGGMRTRGRGGMNLGPSGFGGGNFGGYDDSGMNRRGGKVRGRGMSSMSRGGGGGGAGGNSNAVMNSTTGHSIHMRGLPFEAQEDDVRKFFAPTAPAQVRILYEQGGRPKGECDVDFSSHPDCEMAMKKDKQNMGHRYIELFLKSTPQGNAGMGGGMGMPGNLMAQGNMGGGYGGGYGAGMGMGGGMAGGMGMGGGMGQQMMGGMGGMGGGMNSNYTNFAAGGGMGNSFTNDSVSGFPNQMAQNSGFGF